LDESLLGEYIHTHTTMPMIAPTVPIKDDQIMNLIHTGWFFRSGV
jgi:hypothetical protein